MVERLVLELGAEGSDSGGVGAQVAVAVSGFGADVDDGFFAVGADADCDVVSEFENMGGVRGFDDTLFFVSVGDFPAERRGGSFGIAEYGAARGV